MCCQAIVLTTSRPTNKTLRTILYNFTFYLKNAVHARDLSGAVPYIGLNTEKKHQHSISFSLGMLMGYSLGAIPYTVEPH